MGETNQEFKVNTRILLSYSFIKFYSNKYINKLEYII